MKFDKWNLESVFHSGFLTHDLFLVSFDHLLRILFRFQKVSSPKISFSNGHFWSQKKKKTKTKWCSCLHAINLLNFPTLLRCNKSLRYDFKYLLRWERSEWMMAVVATYLCRYLICLSVYIKNFCTNAIINQMLFVFSSSSSSFFFFFWKHLHATIIIV